MTNKLYVIILGIQHSKNVLVLMGLCYLLYTQNIDIIDMNVTKRIFVYKTNSYMTGVCKLKSVFSLITSP